MSADLAALAEDPSILERSADPGVFVVQACDRARTWLREAIDHGDIDQIAEVKAQAEAVRVYTTAKQYGKDAVLSATEIVRRAERGIGVAVRRGQAEGVFRRSGQSDGNQYSVGAGPAETSSNLESPKDYLPSGNARSDAYAMTDDVDDDEFEAAIEEAKAEENLSRANVVRKVRRATSPPRPPRKSGQQARAILHCMLQLQGTVDRLELELHGGLDEAITPEQAAAWADDLTGVIRPLGRLRQSLKEKASG